jgi:hypothetical protein
VTFKDLKKRIDLTTQQKFRSFEKVLNKPFWIWDKQQHKLEDIKTNGDCCFNHIIGLPQKDGDDKPLYDYEKIIFDSLVTPNGNKHLWIKKATSLVYGLMSKYQVEKVYIDGANPSFIKSLKLQIGEDADYDKVIARYRSEGLGDGTQDMKIVPVSFKSEHKAMLGHCKMILEKDGGRIAINPDRFDKLITSLRTAVDNDGTLDKEATSYNDIFDAFRVALKFYHFREKDE